jgi:hypothetical protein
MRDYNFFQPYVAGGIRRQTDTAISFVPLILLFLLVLTSYPAYNLYRIMQLNQEIETLQASVLDSPDYHLLSEVSSTRAVVAEAKGRLNTLTEMDKTLTAMDWLDEPFLETLMGVFPRDLAIENLVVALNRQVQLSGTATNKPAIAELELNLRNTKRFEQIHVPSITRDATGRTDVFRFTLVMQVKEVGVRAVN